ncbi:MAG: CheY-like chemotaxis protein [Hyphomicrobiaceae bacterium]|jgi:CheY-like chemotaxis protein
MGLPARRPPRPKLQGHILVVEDDADICAMTVAVLASAGLQVSTAADAGQALAQVAAEKFDAIILDWNLSEITGAGLLEALRKTNPHLFGHSAVVTGDLMSIPGMHEAERFGRPVLAKPFRPAQLIETVSALLA